jgi:hypothetical protein
MFWRDMFLVIALSKERFVGWGDGQRHQTTYGLCRLAVQQADAPQSNGLEWL